ncbi:SusC/RagA family TonB-linked outer membrane protein [Parapedobacter sp.]
MINYGFSESGAISPAGRKDQLWRTLKLSAFLILCGCLHLRANVLTVTGVDSNQQRFVSGTVTDEEGNTLEGVTVTLKGTTQVVTTGAEGYYRISVPQQGAILSFSMVGFETSEQVIGSQTTIDVTMKTSTSDLDEVVVVGYATMKKRDLVGAVEQVTGEVLANRPTANLARSLQGEVAGLNISFIDSKPSRSTSLNVRGETSIGAGGSSLVLIDGVEGSLNSVNPQDVESVSVLKDASSTAVYGARGAFGVILITTKSPKKGTPVLNYNGSVSANRRTVIPESVTDGLDWINWWIDSYNGYYNFSRAILDHIDSTVPYTEEIHQMLIARREDPSLPSVMPLEGHSQFEWAYLENTDWYDLFYKDFNMSHEHNLSISGGNEVSDYYISGRFYDVDGIYKIGNENYKKYDFRAKGSLQVRPWFKITNNTSFSSINDYQPKHPRNNFNIQRAINHVGYPLSPVKNPDGSWTTAAAITGYASFSEGTSSRENDYLYLRQKISADIDIIEHTLKFQADYSYNYTNRKRVDMQVPIEFSKRPGVILYESASAGAKLEQVGYNTHYQAANAYLTYSPTLGPDHSLTALLGWNVENQRYETLAVSRADFITTTKPSFSLMDGVSTDPISGGNAWSYMGGFYRLNYSYQGKYLAEISGRYDGSSKFPLNQQWGFFPSASVAWRISDESWMSWSERVVDNAKIRLSAGSMGNGNVSPYSYTSEMSVATASNIVLGGSLPTYTSVGTITPVSLTWEKASTYNVGLDMDFLVNRLSFTGDVYRRNTTDMYTQSVNLPSVYGAAPPKGNNAEMRTDGWEVSLQWRDEAQLAGKPFNYSIKGMLWDSKSVITKYANETGTLGSVSGYIANGGSPSSFYPGMTVGEIWGYEVVGLFKDQADIDNSAIHEFRQASDMVTRPGQVKFADLDGSGVIDPGNFEVNNHGDLRIIGNQSSRYQFGLNLSSSWNGIGLSVFFQGVLKKDYYPGSDAGYFWGKYGRPFFSFIPKNHMDPDQVYSEERDNWDTAYWPRITTYQSNGNRNWTKALEIPNTRYMQNASFVRVKNIQLDYTFDTRLANRIGLQGLNIYLSGENLFTFTPLHKYAPNFDPEGLSYDTDFASVADGYTYPMLKSLTMGLNITF